MATPTTYTYTITPFDSDQFTKIIILSTIITALSSIDTSGSTVDITFKDVLSSGDQTTLTGLVSAYVYSPTISQAPQNPDGVPIVELALRRSETGFINFTICTHDFSDRTTWYQKSVAVTGETLTDLGDGTDFNSANANWINMNSSKLTVDYKKVLERDGSLTTASLRYAVIKVNGTTKTEGASADYTIDYATGVVTFAVSQTGNTVTASYYHNNGVSHCSEFLFVPPPGYCYRVEHIESQFSKNTTFNDSVSVEIWAGGVTGGNTVNISAYGGFAGAYFDAGYGQSRTTYRNMNDLINWCNNQYPTVPACGALVNDIMIFPFLYLIHPVIDATLGILVRLYLPNDNALTAEICTITLYMEKGPVSDA